MPMTNPQALGNLINDLNPYFDAAVGGAPWEMDIFMGVGNPNPANPPAGNANQVWVEVDDRYPGEWSFGGAPQKIRRALRIRYRYRVRSPSGQDYYEEDYLLIGYEGSGGN